MIVGGISGQIARRMFLSADVIVHHAPLGRAGQPSLVHAVDGAGHALADLRLDPGAVRPTARSR